MKRLVCAVGLLLACPVAVAQWQPATGPEGGLVDMVAVDPLDGDSVFVGGNRLFHSTDGGATWARVALPTEGLDDARIRAIAISRDEGGPIIVETRPPLISHDRGATWARLEIGGEVKAVGDIQAGPAGSHVFYAYGGGGICRSDDDGASWKVMGALPDRDLDAQQMLVDRYDAETVSCMARWPRRSGRGGGWFVSRDGGRTFTQWELPDLYCFAADLSTDPDEEGMLYLCARPTGFGRSRMGRFYYSYDDGATWELLWDPEGAEPPAEATLKKVRTIFPEMLASTPPYELLHYALLRSEVGCSPDAPGRAVAVAGGRVQLSDDYGETWVDSMKGFVATQVNRIVFDPNDPKAAFCAHYSRVWYTGDRGRTWTTTERYEYGYVQHVAFAPDGEHAFIVANTVLRGTRTGTDWQQAWARRGYNGPLGLFLDSDDGDGDGNGARSVATLVGDGFLVVSLDGGVTWDDGGKNNLSLREARFDDRYAVHTVDGVPTWFALDPRRGTLWSSTDQGHTWAAYGPTAEHKISVWSMAADEAAWVIDQAGAVHAIGADGTPRESVRTPSGLALRSIACDPGDANVVYIGTRDGRLIRTTDGGASYELIEGGPVGEYMSTLAISPHDGALWVGTGAFGVWILDDPKAQPGRPLSE